MKIIFLVLLISTNIQAIVSVIKKGTIITCPKDNTPVLKVMNDITLYSAISEKTFKGLSGYVVKKGQQFPCGAIHQYFCLHTAEGWIGFDNRCDELTENGDSFKDFKKNQKKEKKELKKMIKGKIFKCVETGFKSNLEFCISKDKTVKCIKDKGSKNNYIKCWNSNY